MCKFFVKYAVVVKDLQTYKSIAKHSDDGGYDDNKNGLQGFAFYFYKRYSEKKYEKASAYQVELYGVVRENARYSE